MELKISFTSQRLTTMEEVSDALFVVTYLIHLRIADINYKLKQPQCHGEACKRLESELEELKKTKDIINSLKGPVVIPI